ncbi:MAG: hypothetical protein EAZ65_01740 [Verrucomicrobia bacterium]|nr:MAG: hypothetical protein EAZ82_00160 [Verrucomicrobiota bacterium]TAF28047.1 MAG: hypothetical protein EAZ71_01745 [Verrucomicrobiota bacterium]TAF42894.1 MAG: hypothetical protein EAZ65_01740 [Verrucomicrobiota bacterium]
MARTRTPGLEPQESIDFTPSGAQCFKRSFTLKQGSRRNLSASRKIIPRFMSGIPCREHSANSEICRVYPPPRSPRPPQPKKMKPKFVSALPQSILPAAAWMVLASSTHAEVLYTFAGPQLVDEVWNYALPDLNLSRGAAASGTLYFKYTVTNPGSNNTTEQYYAGMSFFDGNAEHLGVGNGWDPWAYSAFSTSVGNIDLKSATPDPGAPYQQVRSTDVTTIVIRVNFNSGANDNVTVWLNPNFALTEAAQNPALTTTFTADANFDRIYLREGGGGSGWTYSDVVIAENATDSGFFAVPLTTSTWDGGGTDSNWSTAANWQLDTAPSSGFDLIFPSAANAVSNNDLAAGTAFTGLEFATGASSYELTGNAIGISNFIKNNSGNFQTLSMPLQLNGGLNLETSNASIAIAGPISGPHGITKTGGNRLELTADNSYTGNTTITAGTLAIGNGDTAGSIDPTGTVNFGQSAVTRLEFLRSDDIVVSNPIATNGRANIVSAVGNIVELSGPITGPGEFWTYGPGTTKITPNAGSAGYTPTIVNASGILEVSDFSTSTLGTSLFCIGQGGSGTLRYTGPSTSTDRVAAYALQGVGTNSFIEVTSPGAELTFTQPLNDNDNFGAKGLTKIGAGTLILAAPQGYDGDTVIEEGTLTLNQAGFADSSSVTVGDSGQLKLDFVGSDTVTTIVLGSDSMPAGTYSAATHPNFISGTGSLLIPSSDPFPAWIAGFTFAAGADLSQSGDPDGDGLSNSEEFAFGLAPNNGSSSNPVVVPVDASSGTFSYTRRRLDLTDLIYSVWYSTDLATWTEDTGATEGNPLTNGETETVPITLTPSLLSNSKLFIQVRAN